MDWKDVGDWLKNNAGSGAALVGSLLTGNVPGAVAAGVALVGSATGQGEPKKALEALQTDPATVLRLRELAVQEESSIREHIRAMEELRLTDLQAEHREQQETIRTGDNSTDEYVRRTRPIMARQSWRATVGYAFLFEGAKILGYGDGANWDIAMILLAPSAAYMGFRTWDKIKKAR